MGALRAAQYRPGNWGSASEGSLVSVSRGHQSCRRCGPTRVFQGRWGPGALTHHCIAPRHNPVGTAVRVNPIWEPGGHAFAHQTPKCCSFREGGGKRNRQWRGRVGALGRERVRGWGRGQWVIQCGRQSCGGGHWGWGWTETHSQAEKRRPGDSQRVGRVQAGRTGN